MSLYIVKKSEFELWCNNLDEIAEGFPDQQIGREARRYRDIEIKSLLGRVFIFGDDSVRKYEKGLSLLEFYAENSPRRSTAYLPAING